MDRKKITSLLRRSAAQESDRTPFCPDDDEIAGYVDRTLPAADRTAIERHLGDCSACIKRVGLTVRLTRDNERSEARRSRAKGPSRDSMTVRWAAAAMVVIAVGWLAIGPTGVETEFRETRTLDRRILEPRITASVPGSHPQQDRLVVRWSDVPGTLYYEVRLISDIGDVIHRERAESLEWVVDSSLDLTPGVEYFIRVDAVLSDQQSIQSEHIPIRLIE